MMSPIFFSVLIPAKAAVRRGASPKPIGGASALGIPMVMDRVIQQAIAWVLLTTLNHLNRDVIELDVRDSDGRVEIFRPTGNYKFYSVSRNE